jgi:hypothetical protein
VVIPAWDFVADSYILKSQHLKNSVLRTSDNFPRRAPTRELNCLGSKKKSSDVTQIQLFAK